jgi:hypothetical protein
MIIGCESDRFPDSWFSFKKEDGSGVIRVYFESKKRENNKKLSATYFNEHQRKVKNKGGVMHYIFVFIGDYDISSIEADDGEYIIGTNNMGKFYGKILSLKRQQLLYKE